MAETNKGFFSAAGVAACCAVVTVCFLIYGSYKNSRNPEWLNQLRINQIQQDKQFVEQWKQKLAIFDKELRLVLMSNGVLGTTSLKVPAKDFFDECSKCATHFGNDFEHLCSQLRKEYKELFKIIGLKLSELTDLEDRSREYSEFKARTTAIRDKLDELIAVD